MQFYTYYILLYHHISGRFFTVVGDDFFDPKRQVLEVPDQGAAQGGMEGFTSKVGLNGI